MRLVAFTTPNTTRRKQAKCPAPLGLRLKTLKNRSFTESRLRSGRSGGACSQTPSSAGSASGKAPRGLPAVCTPNARTGSPDGKWVKFVVHRVNGPAQPHGHWPSQNTGSTSPRPASLAPPQVFCQTPPAQKKGEPPTGFYRVRPPGCRFHRLGLEENSLSDLVFRIHWRHWTATSASGIGRYPVEVINIKTGRHSKSSGPEVVRLSRPRRICGHKVFTKLELRVYIHGQVAGDFESELDEVGEGEEGCPQRR